MLYERIIEQGTISEPDGKPKPQFALPATVNWMRALLLLAENEPIDFGSAIGFYSDKGIGRRPTIAALEENTVLEQLFLSLHHLSALDRFRKNTTVADHARVGILAWYYGVSNAASAMTAAQSGSFQEDHAGTARLWDEQIASRGLAMGPFGWRVSSLVEATFSAETDAIRGASDGTLQKVADSPDQAIGAAAQYLSGSAKWYAARETENVRKRSQFRELGVDNFRTQRAQRVRDQHLERKSVGFLHQASRYRGKANYREALFLSYGRGTEDALDGFVDDMFNVLKAFLAMSGAFAHRRLGGDIWAEFVADIDENSAFSLRTNEVWP